MDGTKLLSVVANVEVVVAFWPEMLRVADLPARDSLFQRLDGGDDERAGSLPPTQAKGRLEWGTPAFNPRCQRRDLGHPAVQSAWREDRSRITADHCVL